MCFSKAIFITLGTSTALIFIYNRHSSKAVNLIVLQTSPHKIYPLFLFVLLKLRYIERSFKQVISKISMFYGVICTRYLYDEAFILEYISEIQFHVDIDQN